MKPELCVSPGIAHAPYYRSCVHVCALTYSRPAQVRVNSRKVSAVIYYYDLPKTA